MFLKLVDS